jgi:exosortase/archaeosortase family protein
MYKILNIIKRFFTEPKWENVRAVFWFCLITVIIHIIWKIWELKLHYFPVSIWMAAAADFFNSLVFNQSTWVVTHILHIKLTTIGTTLTCENGAGITLVGSCSGIKQIMQFAILMLVFPGPWKHKSWFIPLGMIIVHFTNVLRVILLTIIAEHWPSQIMYAHDNWLRFMFYVMIFILWLIWVEKISSNKQK